jgi:hypothetical protein
MEWADENKLRYWRDGAVYVQEIESDDIGNPVQLRTKAAPESEAHRGK